MLKDGISVIICCYNSGWIIKRCLQALKSQIVHDGLSWEVVLVDNNSTDNTVQEALQSISGSKIDFRIVKESAPGLLNARKRGISEAKYVYTIYCDDDNILCPEYVETMYVIFASDSTIGAVGGMGIPEYECEPDSRIIPYIKNYAVGSQKSHIDWLYGAGSAFRTEIVLDIYRNQKCYLIGRQGSKTLAGDDGELVKSVLLRGYSITSTDSITFNHVLKSNRLNYHYLREMVDGFIRVTPAVMIMDMVLRNQSYKYIYIQYIKTILSFLYSLLFIWRNDYKMILHNKWLLLTSYNFWGFAKLSEIYDSWLLVKKQHTDVTD